MTRLRWDRLQARQTDPGTVIGPIEGATQDNWVPPQVRAKLKIARAKATEQLLQRSEHIRYKAVIKKFGPQRAIALGVPRYFVEDFVRGKERTQKKELRAREKKQERAAKRADLTRQGVGEQLPPRRTKPGPR